jgi:hypothetical protein
VKSLFNKDGGVSTIAYLAEISVSMVFVVHVNAPTCMDCVLFLYQVSSNVLCMISISLQMLIIYPCFYFLNLL